MEQFTGIYPTGAGEGQRTSEAGKTRGILEHHRSDRQRDRGNRPRHTVRALATQLFDPLFCSYIAVWLLVHYFRYLQHPLPYVNGWLTDFVFIPAVAHFARTIINRFFLQGRTCVYPLPLLILAAIYCGLLCEWILPRFVSHTVGDVWDALAYLGGAVFFYYVHQKRTIKPQ